MDPRDATYPDDGMEIDHSYSLDAAKGAALEVMRATKPTTVQALLDRLKENDWHDDDLNRRAILYLLDEGRLVIEAAVLSAGHK